MDNNSNIYFIGSEGSSLENVILGKINKNLVPNWQIIYPSDQKMFSLEMDNGNIYFMLISLGVQHIVKLDTSSGGYVKAISNTDTSPRWTGPGCRIIISNDNSTLYASGYQCILKSDINLSFLTKYPISIINSVDQIMNVKGNLFYISSGMSTYYANLMFE